MVSSKKTISLWVLLIYLAFLPSFSWAESAPLNASLYQQGTSNATTARTVVVPAQTVINISLSEPLHSKQNKVGDSISAIVKESVYVGPFLTVPEGSIITGKITELNQEKQKGGPNPYIMVHFDGVQRPQEAVTLPFKAELIAYKTGLNREDYVWRLPHKKDKLRARLGSVMEGAVYGLMINPIFGAPAGAGFGILKSVLIDKVAQRGSIKINSKEQIPISVQEGFDIPVIEQ